MSWADLETALNQEPLFFVEKPDGLERKGSEDSRAATLVALMHRCAPKCEIAHVKNEGKHNHALAKRLGVVTGFGDYIVTWPNRGIAFVELKGFNGRGLAG